MAYPNQDHCERCGIPIPHVDEDAGPAARLCDACFKKADRDDNPVSFENASRRIIGEMLEKPEYKYVDPKLLAGIVRDTVSRYIDLELEQEV